MHMVTRLSRKIGVVIVFKNDWAAEDKRRYRTRVRVRGTKNMGAAILTTHSAPLHSFCGLQSISRSMVERQSLCPSLVARSFCFRLLPTLRRRPTVVTWR